MKNWAGLDIQPGMTVWRGARDGNTSSYKIGVVDSVNEAKGTARVKWEIEPGYWMNGWVTSELPKFMWENLVNVRRLNSSGSPTIDSLCPVIVNVNRLIHDAEEWQRLSEKVRKMRNKLVP